MNEPLLELKKVTVSYQGRLPVLQEVSLAIDEGEIVALMGPNGAGKSTVLKTIFGLTQILSGTVCWHQKSFKPISHEVVERGIAFVPQGRRVFHHLSVLENLEIGGFMITGKQELARRIDEVMKLFPILREKRNAASGALSGGQQQMLAIARGLMTDPKVLLLDEPSLGLSPKIVKEVFETIHEINKRHRTAIMVVEHNLKSLMQIVDRAYILDKGRVVAEGDPKDLTASGILEKVFMGTL